jgi:hypothetical protein
MTMFWALESGFFGHFGHENLWYAFCKARWSNEKCVACWECLFLFFFSLKFLPSSFSVLTILPVSQDT